MIEKRPTKSRKTGTKSRNPKALRVLGPLKAAVVARKTKVPLIRPVLLVSTVASTTEGFTPIGLGT